tara:strand:+ start:720 stop:1451 length:732 start_codon:yes stop_codon:yes gene_type:complete
MNIVVVGCGFIGSHVADELAKLLYSQDITAHFKFVDFDTWESRNAANQNVSGKEASSSGVFKSDTCAHYANAYSGITAESLPEKLTAQNAKMILEGSDLVIDCVDNIPTRQLLWGFSRSGTVGPCMHTGISRKGEGIINWSSPSFDTFPFRPDLVAGRTLKEQDFKEPPCEMYKYRTAGVILVQGIAKAAAFYAGVDPWGMLDGAEEPGIMTCWNTHINGCKLHVDDIFLDDGFFPIYERGGE